jgi:hypothetical protein
MMFVSFQHIGSFEWYVSRVPYIVQLVKAVLLLFKNRFQQKKIKIWTLETESRVQISSTNKEEVKEKY